MYLARMWAADLGAVHHRLEVPHNDVNSQVAVEVRNIGACPRLLAGPQVDVAYECESHRRTRVV